MRHEPIRLLVVCPPRHGKSELCSVYTPLSYLANWPRGRVILASYEHNFATEWGRKVRNIIDDTVNNPTDAASETV